MAKRCFLILTTFLLTAAFFALASAVASADMVIISPSADATVVSDKPALNLGGKTTLNSAYDSDDNRQAIPYMLFNLSIIPGDATIDQAILKIYLSRMSGRETVDFDIIRSTSPWTEPGITWSNKPTGQSFGKTVNLSSRQGFKNIDITPVVAGWLAGTYPNHGIFFTPEKKADYDAVFQSKETETHQPYLTVYYTPKPSPVTGAPGTLPMAEGRPPVITDIKAEKIDETSAVITWRTDVLADSFVRFGPSLVYDTTVGSMVDKSVHAVKISGLKPGTKYHYRVTSQSKSGLESISADYSFRTEAAASEETLPSGSWQRLMLIVVAGAVVIVGLELIVIWWLVRFKTARAKKE